MAAVDPEELFQGGRSHALAAKLLYESSIEYAVEHGIPDVEKFAFNGTFSLSLYYLIGLGFELLLKSAYVKFGGEADSAHLRTAIGHDLVKALEHAESVGFTSNVGNLSEIIGHLSEPYRQHFFRYSRPDTIALPSQKAIFDAFESLDRQLCDVFGWTTYQ